MLSTFPVILPVRLSPGERLRQVASLAALTVVALLATPAAGSFIDQHQDAQNGGTAYWAERTIAQTFTSGVTGQLERIDVYVDAFFEPANYPATMEIRTTENGLPTDQVLVSRYFSNGFPLHWNSISNLPNVSLTAGEMYAIVFWDDDPTLTIGPTNGVGVRWDPNAYPAGRLLHNSGSGWQVVMAGGVAGDMAFRTWMVPEPTASLLLGLGVSSLLFRRRRCSRK